MRSVQQLAITLLTVLIGTAPLGAQGVLLRSYGVADGLPSDKVLCLVSDRDGFLWTCTNNGLARFDGSRFVSYGTDDGLPDPVVNNFLHTRSGTRWAATNGGGIARFEPGAPGPDGRVLTAFPVGSSGASMRVNVLFEQQDGTLLAGTDGGLFRARRPEGEPRFDLLPVEVPGVREERLQIWSVAQDDTGRTWVGTSAGLVLLAGHERPMHIPVAPIRGTDHVRAIAPDASGRLWLGHERGLVVWVPTVEEEHASSPPAAPLTEAARPCVEMTGAVGRASLPDAAGAVCHWAPDGETGPPTSIWGMLRAPDGRLWMASAAGLFAVDGEAVRRFPETGDMIASGYNQVAIDRGGDVWIGSGRGATRILRRGFTHFTADDGLVGLILRVFGGPDGHLYAVSAGPTIFRRDGERWTAVRPRLQTPAGVAGSSPHGAALLDRSGGWWIGTEPGLLRFPAVKRLEDLASAEHVAHYTTADGLAGDDVWHLFEDGRGDVWIARRNPGLEPLTRWERSTGRLHRYGPAQGLPAGATVRALAEDRSGALWASLWGGGMARFDGQRFQHLPPGEGVPAGPRSRILLDTRGWLWVGGRELVYSTDPEAREPVFRTYRTAEGRPVRADFIGEDGDGRVYAGSPADLVRFRPGDDGLQRLGTAGLSADLYGLGHRDDDGTLWIAYEGRLLRYDPGYKSDAHPPRVRIGGLSVAGRSLPVPPMGALHLAPVSLDGGRQVRIDYFGLGFGVNEPLRFQVRLDGAGEDWSSPRQERTALYAGLGPGRYRFQVRAVGAAGAATPEPATVTFTVPPPFWQRGWFIAVVGLTLASLVAIGHRQRVRRLLELERVRTRIAADLHDDLGASLARVSLLAEAVRRKVRESPAAADQMLGEIGETARSLVSAAGDIAFAIDPGRGGLETLAARVRRFAEELLAGTEVEWSFRIEGKTAHVALSSEQRRHLLAILKEALHNAVRHGQPGHVTLTLIARGGVLEAEVTDDGRGFVATASGDDAIGGGQGLRNLRSRARELGGSLEIDSCPGSGTRVSLSFPL